MTQKNAAPQANVHRNQGERLKDEVYRQMFRLESHRPGAERDLAIALLRALVASDAGSKVGVDRPWLRKICPICLAMIEAAAQAADAGEPCIQ